MKANSKGFTTCASVQAVRGMLIAITLAPAAYTANAFAQTATQQTQQEKKVEIGVGAVSDSSFKFGEYNGLEKKGGYFIGNFDLRGGAAYNSDSTQRWRVTGTNLGLETRILFAEFAMQGKFRMNFGYDELLKNRSDSYQTPYQGAGTNMLTLPGNWIAPKVPQVSATAVNFRSLDATAGTGSTYVAGVLTPPTAAQLTALANMRAADLPAFQNVDLFSKRTRYEGGFSYSFDQQWEVPASASHEHKEGYKWLGAVSSQVSEFSAILPDLIDQDIEQANLSLNYKASKGFLTAAYYGSFFKNNVKSMTWQDVNDPTKSTTMGSAPSNQFNQLSLTGGYNLSSTTRLTMNGSYGRGTQNDAFLGPSTAANGQLAFGLPAASPNALVVSKALNLKLTAKPVKKLKLSAGYKFDDRDNRTPVNTYLFQDANESKSGASSFSGLSGLPAGLGSNTNIYNNRAYSKQINQLNLQADYAVAKRQWLQAGYDWQNIERKCNGSWINCADAPTTRENTLRAEWRANVWDSLSGRIGYAYSMRTAPKYDENAFLALVPMANVVPGAPTAGATLSAYAYLLQNGLTGFGPLAGLPATALTGNAAIFSPNNNILPQALYGSRNNINELPGMRRYMVADRNRHKLRSSLNWQATDKFSVESGLDLNKDDYIKTVYGLQQAKSWALNLDGTYAATEDSVASIFYTYEDQRFTSAGDAYGSNSTTAFQGQASNTLIADACYPTIAARNANAKMDRCLNWFKNNRDKVQTFGLVFTQKNLMAGKLDLTGNLIVSQARTDTGVRGGSYVNNPLALAAPAPALPAGVPAVYFITASDFPTVRADERMFRLTGNYAIRKATALRLFYIVQHLKANDYAYDGMQYGTGTNYLPTNETVPHYTVQVVGFSVIYRF